MLRSFFVRCEYDVPYTRLLLEECLPVSMPILSPVPGSSVGLCEVPGPLSMGEVVF